MDYGQRACATRAPANHSSVVPRRNVTVSRMGGAGIWPARAGWKPAPPCIGTGSSPCIGTGSSPCIGTGSYLRGTTLGGLRKCCRRGSPGYQTQRGRGPAPAFRKGVIRAAGVLRLTGRGAPASGAPGIRMPDGRRARRSVRGLFARLAVVRPRLPARRWRVCRWWRWSRRRCRSGAARPRWCVGGRGSWFQRGRRGPRRRLS